MVSVLASNVVDRGFERQSGQTKDYRIGSCCFFAKNFKRRKSKNWLTRNQDNVRVGRHVYTQTVSGSKHHKHPPKRVSLEQSRPHHHLIDNYLFSL